MKFFLLMIICTCTIAAQERTMNIRGYDIELGMSMDEIWTILKKDFNVVEENDGSFYVADKNAEPVGMIFFKNDRAIRIIKDWGTKTKSNVGQVFKTLWNILKQYENDLDETKLQPLETFTEKGSKFSIIINLTKNRYLEILIQHSVTIVEVLEETES